MSEPNQPDPGRKQPLTGQESYNLVTDTVAGPNLRWKDNLFQAVTILICLLLGAGIGYLMTPEGWPGALAGAFIGLLVGLLGSGLFLMIYRAIRHSRGQHD